MFPEGKRKKRVKQSASENGLEARRKKRSASRANLASEERTSSDVARAQGRLAAGVAAGQRDRFASRAWRSPQSNDPCPAPGLTRTAERAPSSHCKKESTMP